MEKTKSALVHASMKLVKVGLTSLHCIISNLTELNALRELKREQQLPQSIYATIPGNLVDRLGSGGLSRVRSRGRFRIGGLKLYLDGSLGARPAALNQPYDDAPRSRGMITLNSRELRRVASKARDSKFQLCIHAIGDKAVDLAVEVLARSLRQEVAGSSGIE